MIAKKCPVSFTRLGNVVIWPTYLSTSTADSVFYVGSKIYIGTWYIPASNMVLRYSLYNMFHPGNFPV